MKVQWKLSTILLLVTTIAVWVAAISMTRSTPRLIDEAESVSAIMNRLLIRDPEKYAVLHLQPRSWDDNAWKVWLPEGHRYRLCVATRGVQYGPETVFPEKPDVVELQPGEHEIRTMITREDQGWKIVIANSDDEHLQILETADWNKTEYYYSHGPGFGRTEQFGIAQRMLVYRVVYHKSTRKGETVPRNVPADGLQIWLECLDP